MGRGIPFSPDLADKFARFSIFVDNVEVDVDAFLPSLKGQDRHLEGLQLDVQLDCFHFLQVVQAVDGERFFFRAHHIVLACGVVLDGQRHVIVVQWEAGNPRIACLDHVCGVSVVGLDGVPDVGASFEVFALSNS